MAVNDTNKIINLKINLNLIIINVKNKTIKMNGVVGADEYIWNWLFKWLFKVSKKTKELDKLYKEQTTKTLVKKNSVGWRLKLRG